MKRIFLLMTIPLFFLTFSLLPPERVAAHHAEFSPNLSALDVVAEVNALRASNSLPLYQVNSILMDVAQFHANYIASTGVVSHFGVNGERPYQRAIAAGYPVAGDLSLGGLFAENVDSGLGLTASDVVDNWQGDSDHLKTMLSADLKDIGVGVAIVNGTTYYVLTGDPAAAQTSSPTISTPTVGTPGTQSAQVSVSTPLENGEVYHVVQLKEALWSIALAYDTTVEQIKLLNGLATDEIFEGQKLLIQRPTTDTPTPTEAVTATFGIPTSTSTQPVPPTITSTPPPLPVPPASRQNGGAVFGIIVLIALLAAGIGAWLGRKRSA
jgi:LysM repeat protein